VNPQPRVGDVWASAGGLRQFRLERFVRSNGQDAALMRSTRLGQTAVIGLSELADPARFRLVERYDAEPTAHPLDKLTRDGATVLL
jgi:hypothetical protein